MQTVQRFFSSFLDKFRKQGIAGKTVLASVTFFVLCCLCSIPIAILTLSKLSSKDSSTPINVSGIQTMAFNTAVAGVNQTATENAQKNTPEPTNTSLAPTATPVPIVLSGSGDSVVDVQKWEGVAIAHIKYSGGRNFVVQNYNSNGKQLDLLVNTIGNYEGTVALDVLDGQQTTRFEIKSSGPWEIQILSLWQVKRVIFPGTFEGNGDDVVLLAGIGKPDLLKIDASQAERNFIVFGIGYSRDLLVNKIAPYTGTVIVSGNLPTTNGTLMLTIKATGKWSIEVTAK